MKRKISLFGLMLVMLFTIAAPVAYAISTIDVDTFKEKLEKFGYKVYDYDNHASGSKDNISISFKKYDSDKDAKEDLAEACEELDEMNDEAGDSIKNSSYSKSNCEESTKSSKGYLKYSAEKKDADDSIYIIAYRKGDTIVSATGKKEDKDEIIKAMKKLGYYPSNTWVVVVVILVLVGGGVAIFVITKNKNKASMMNNGMMNQPQNNMFGGSINNQPQNDMFGGPVNNQSQNDMFGGPVNNQSQNDMFGGPVNNQPQDFWNQQVKNNNMFDNQNNQQ